MTGAIDRAPRRSGGSGEGAGRSAARVPAGPSRPPIGHARCIHALARVAAVR